ncbi:FAD/NAD(P)-binding domain-containing protein [Meredithblackwellia eburnea MCA 4105]
MLRVATPRILISGAGLGGLALAQGLRRLGINFHIYERDVSPTSRTQGYRIRMNEAGSNALRQVLNDHVWKLFEETCGEAVQGGFRVNAVTGDDLGGAPGPPPSSQPGNAGFGPAGQPSLLVGGGPPVRPGKFYTVDRSVLRRVLFSGIEDKITWGCSVDSYTLSEAAIVANLSSGSSAEGTLLVGADSLHSSIRRQLLPDLTLVDTRSRAIYGKTLITSQLEKELDSRALQKMCMFRETTTPFALLTEPIRFSSTSGLPGSLPPDYIYWVLTSREENFPTLGSPSSVEGDSGESNSSNPAADLAVRITSQWSEGIKPLFKYQNTSSTAFIAINAALPPIPAWKSDPRVTLIGDSLHLMPPTGGVGANTAMEDVVGLLRVIENGVEPEEMARWEEEARKRGGDNIALSVQGGAHMFGMRPLQEGRKL